MQELTTIQTLIADIELLQRNYSGLRKQNALSSLQTALSLKEEESSHDVFLKHITEVSSLITPPKPIAESIQALHGFTSLLTRKQSLQAQRELAITRQDFHKHISEGDLVSARSLLQSLPSSAPSCLVSSMTDTLITAATNTQPKSELASELVSGPTAILVSLAASSTSVIDLISSNLVPLLLEDTPITLETKLKMTDAQLPAAVYTAVELAARAERHRRAAALTVKWLNDEKEKPNLLALEPEALTTAAEKLVEPLLRTARDYLLGGSGDLSEGCQRVIHWATVSGEVVPAFDRYGDALLKTMQRTAPLCGQDVLAHATRCSSLIALSDALTLGPPLLLPRWATARIGVLNAASGARRAALGVLVGSLSMPSGHMTADPTTSGVCRTLEKWGEQLAAILPRVDAVLPPAAALAGDAVGAVADRASTMILEFGDIPSRLISTLSRSAEQLAGILEGLLTAVDAPPPRSLLLAAGSSWASRRALLRAGGYGSGMCVTRLRCCAAVLEMDVRDVWRQWRGKVSETVPLTLCLMADEVTRLIRSCYSDNAVLQSFLTKISVYKLV